MATLTFTNAYRVNAATTPVGKESNSHDFIFTSLGQVTIQDDASSLLFSGNDVAAVGLNIQTVNYYGWISRPIKVGGVVKGFYFWTDPDFHSVADATTDGNHDGDDNVADNIGFILVVDQSYFTNLGLGHSVGDILNVGSSSDRVDNALNQFIIANVAPVAVADTGTAVEAGGANNGTAGSDATGFLLANDTDANTSDTKTVTKVGTTTAGTSVTASTTSTSGGTLVHGTYGDVTIGSDGSYTYVVTNTNTTVEALRTSSNTLTDTFTYTMRDTAGLTSTSTLTITIQGANDKPTAVNDVGGAKVSMLVDGTAYSGTDTIGSKATGNVLTNDTDKDTGDTQAAGGLTVLGQTATGTYLSNTSGTNISSFVFAATSNSFNNGVLVGDYLYTAKTGGNYYLLKTAGGADITLTSKTLNADGTYTMLLSGVIDHYVVGGVNTAYPLTANSTLVDFLGDNTHDAGSSLPSGKEATFTSSSTVETSTLTVTTASITGSVVAGMTITGTNIPSGAIVTGVAISGANTVITLNKILSTAPSGTFTFSAAADSLVSGTYGSLLLGSDGSYTYTPTPSSVGGASGNDVFTYTMKDAGGLTSTATLTINVTASSSNDPNAKDDAVTGTELGSSVATVHPTGNLISGTLTTGTGTVVADTTPSGSNLSSNPMTGGRTAGATSFTSVPSGGNVNIVGTYGTLNLTSAGGFTYTIDNSNTTVNALNTGQSVSEIFYYKITNSKSASDTATLTVTINGSDDAPTATTDSATAVEASGLSNAVPGYNPSGNVLWNDTDVDNTLAQLSVTAIRLGSTANAGTAGTVGTALVGQYGTLTISSTGAWTYVVDNTNTTVNALGTASTPLVDSFNYTVSDGSGGTATTNAILNISIQGAADTIAVNNIFVNEGPNNYAVFKVTGVAGIPLTLALSNSAGMTSTDVKATLADDLTGSLEYLNGSTWTAYGSGVTIPVGGQLLVRIAIHQDNVYEGNESFSLVATVTSAGDVTSATGIATINDEGQGDIFLVDNTSGNSTGTGTDNDTPTISVSSPTVTEGGDAVFTVSINKTSVNDIRFVPSLVGSPTYGTAVIGTDTSSTLYYYTGSAWAPVTGAVAIPALSSSVQLSVHTTDDPDIESAETFKLTTGYVDTVTNQSGAFGIGTINDNDSGGGLVISDASRVTVETPTTATFTVKLLTQPSSNVTVTISGLDTTEGSLSATVLTFTNSTWDTLQTVTITGVDDTLDDGNIDYTLTLTSGGSDAAYTGGAQTGTVLVTNQDNDLPPSLSIGDATTTEGGNLEFVVTRTGALGGTTTVNYSTVADQAGNSDYTSVSGGTLTFAATDVTKTITIATTDDHLVEGTETFTVALSNASDTTSGGALISDASGLGTITDNDTALLVIAGGPLTTSETVPSTQTFTVKLNSQPLTDVVVTITGLDSTEGGLSASTLTFTNSTWDTLQTVTVSGVDDDFDDGNIGYTLTLTASGDSTYTGKTGTVGVTNLDNDLPPSLSIGDATTTEGGNLEFVVTRTGALGGSTTVNYSTVANPSGAGNSDYTSVSGGTLTFAATITTQTITIATTDDHLVEGTETFTVALSNANDTTSGGALISDASGLGTITDNDTALLVIAGGPLTTSETVPSTQTFTVKLNSQPLTDVVVTITGLDSTEGGLSASTLTFTNSTWDTLQTVTVSGVDDDFDDGNIGYTLTLTASGDSTYTGKTGTVGVTNLDNDLPPSLSIGDATTTEGGNLEFVVTRTGALGGTTTVNYSTVADQAGNSDYTSVSGGTLTFAATDVTKTITIATTDDHLVEGTETFTVALSNANDTTSGGALISDASGLGTITDNDTALLVIAGGPLTTSETVPSTQTFTVKLNSQPLTDVVVTITGLDSTEGGLSASTLTFTNSTWDTLQTVTVSGVDDDFDDGNIGYTLTLTASGDSTYTGKTGTVGVTNLDNDLPPSLSIGDATTTEGGNLEFVVTRTGALGGSTTVNYSTVANPSGAGNSDYTSVSGGTLTFAPTITTQTITIATTDDHLVEGTETFTVALSNASDTTSGGALISDASGLGTITDNDTALLVIAGGPLTTSETVPSTQTFTVKLNSQPLTDVVVTITGLDSTEGGLSASTLTFTNSTWDTLQTVTVSGVDDDFDDGNIGYTLTLTASGDSTYTGKTGTVGVTNLDNDLPPSLQIGDASVIEGGNLVFVVQRAGATGGTTTVNYSTVANPTGAGNADYTSVSGGTLTFAPGDLSKNITIATTSDSLVEGTETFTVVLSGGVDTTSGGVSISDDTGLATITDNDVAALVISDATLITTEAQPSVKTFTVKLNSQPVSDVTVTISGLDSTEGGLSVGTLTFSNSTWDTLQTVTVTGVDDTIDDGNIDYSLTLTSSGDSTYSDTHTQTGTVVVTNIDNDAPPTLSIANAPTITEGGNAIFVVTRTGALGGTTTVNYSTVANPSGAGNSDYTSVSGGTLTFAPTVSTQTITIATTDDHLVESAEDFTVVLSNVNDATSDAETISGATGTATITDNDVAGLIISDATLTTNEAQPSTKTFTVKLKSQPVSDVTVTITGLDSTEGGLSASTLTFTNATWDTLQTVTVSGVDDTIDDGNIPYTLTLTSGGDSTYATTHTQTGTVVVTNVDDDAPPSLSIANAASVAEGGNALFVVTRTGALGGTTTVNYNTTIGSAVAADFATVSGGTLTFAPNVVTQTITIATTDDHLVESTENFTVVLSNVSDATSDAETITGATGTGTITDNDVAGLVLNNTTRNTSETQPSTTTFTVKLNSQPVSNVTVTITGLDTTEGALSTSTLTFTNASWDTTQTVTISGVDDQVIDHDVGYTLTLTSGGDATYAGANAKTATVAVTNADDDVAIIAVAAPSDISEGSNAVFTVTLSKPSDFTTEVSLGFVNGTAGSGDYTAASMAAYYFVGSVKTPLTITSGKVTVPVSVQTFYVTAPTVDDVPFEGPETFRLNATITGGSSNFGIATIVDDGSGKVYDDHSSVTGGAPDDDRTIVLTSTPTVSEGSRAVFKAVLNAASTATTPITLSLSNGTAQSTDYASDINNATAYYYDIGGTKHLLPISGGQVTLAANVTTFYVSVNTTDDIPSIYEGPETFSLTAAVTNGQGNVSASVTILDDGTGKFYDDKGVESGSGTPDNDKASINVVGEPDVSEGSNAVFTVTLTTASDLATEITLTTGAGSDNTEANDYSTALTAYYYTNANTVRHDMTVTANKISLPAGVMVFYVSVATTPDSPKVYEGPETFTLNAVITGGDSDSGTSTILDDGTGRIHDPLGAPIPGTPDNDKPTISVAGLQDVSEGSNAIFTVTLSNASDLLTSIDLSFGAGTDSAGPGDYNPGIYTAYYYVGDVQTPMLMTGSKVSVPAGVTSFYVSLPTTNDSPPVYEGPETLTFAATIVGGPSASTTATILDNGAGKIHDPKGAQTPGTPDNDLAHITVVGEPDVSEGSNAIFTVTLSSAYAQESQIALQLGAGTDTTEPGDYSTTMQAYYYVGAAKTTLAITGGAVMLPSGVTSFYVSVPTTGDTPPVYEGPETFTLTATGPSSLSGSGTSTILDDGRGRVHDDRGAENGGTPDDDRPVLTVVGKPDVSEGSSAIFTVSMAPAQGAPTTISLTLGAGSDTTEAGDYATTYTAYYYVGAVKTSLPVTGGSVVLPAGVSQFFVNVPTTADSPAVYEGAETFTLAASTAGASASGTSTILDDGTGHPYDDTGTPTSGTPDNDRPVLTVVGKPDVSEGSNAIFTVTQAPAQGLPTTITLGLGAGADTAQANDYSTSMTAYYYVGSVKTSMPIIGGAVVLPAGVSQFFVSVPTTADTPAVYEGAERFTLSAATTSASASGTSTILDDGTGHIYDDTGTPSSATPDNDRGAIHVTGLPDVSEGSRAVFTVTLDVASTSTTEISLALSNGTAQSNDYQAGTLTAYYYVGDVKTTLTITDGKINLPAGVTTFYVSTNTTADSPAIFEGAESFTLSASVTGGDSDNGQTVIVDDGTGHVYDDRGVVIPGTPDNDRPTLTVTGKPDVSEGTNAVFTVAMGPASSLATVIDLALGASGDTATVGDYNASMTAYYFEGAVKQALVMVGGRISLPAGVTTFFVSTGTTADTVYEGAESFTLRATISGGATGAGTSTIVDNGTGHTYDDHAAQTTGTADDDRPVLTVADAPGVSEGTNAVFVATLSRASAMPLEIAGMMGYGSDTAQSSDYSLAGATAYYFDGGGVQHSLTASNGHLVIPAGVTTFYVKMPTVVDSAYEGAERFTLGMAIVGNGASTDTGTATILDDGTGLTHDDRNNTVPGTPDDDRPRTMTADLDPASDNGPSNTDHITSIIDPDFTINAGSLLVAGQTVQLLAPDGHIEGSVIVTAADVIAGKVNVPTSDLDDGTYVYMAQILTAGGTLVAQSAVNVTVITDRDGIQPSIELAANGGDFNHDGIFDWEQNNVAQFPVTSVADFLAGVNAPDSSFGAILAGSPATGNPSGAVQLDSNAQLLNISVSALPGNLPANMQQASPVFNFSVTSQDGGTLADIDPSRAGLQTRVVIDLPAGVVANTYIKFNATTGTWFEYLDDGNLATFDDGATLLDFNNDGRIDRVVLTLTDGGIGDADHAANGTIVDPGMLALKLAAPPPPPPPPAATPVYSVLLEGGDRYYTTSASEAATMSQGTANVFEGVRFDSLSTALGGRALLANYNPFTGDWYFAANGDAMPYICYEPMPGAGFQAAAAGQGTGSDFHLFLNSAGQTQLVTSAEATSLGLSNAGFADWGVIFRTTTTSAFAFDAEAYLVANQSSNAVKALVQSLSASFTSTTSAGFVDAVEQYYLAQPALVGVAHGTTATAADVNLAFGTHFTG